MDRTLKKNLRHSVISKNDTNGKHKDNKTEFPLVDMSIKTALENVTKSDCSLSKEFFKSQTSVDKKDRFDMTVVHTFSLFQNCLKCIKHLNALLGCPYLAVGVTKLFFSGTLLYNLYELKNQKNLNQHICEIFKDSPSLLQLFISVSTKILGMLKK